MRVGWSRARWREHRVLTLFLNSPKQMSINEIGSEVFEIANPSDAYTIKGAFMAAAIAVAILGRGAYGIPGTPVLFGWDDWLKEKGIDDLGAYITAHKTEIVAALDSVLIGDARAREEVEATLRRIPPEQHEAWLADRHGLRRSSMNDIGATAAKLSARLRSEKS